MVVNYYKKFNFSREVEKQDAILRLKLKQDKKLYFGFKSELEKNREKLNLLKEEGQSAEAEKLEDIIERTEKELRKLEKKIEKIDNMLPEEGEDTLTAQDKISDAYFEIRYIERMHLFEKEYNTICTLPETSEKELKIRDLRKRTAEFIEVYRILGNTDNRKKYHKELERQEYLESLENDRLAREKEEENQVKKVLGEDFNPDMSYWKRNDDSYTWKVRLYNEPEKLFVGTTNYEDTPQINQRICAYRYGTFEYGALIKDDGTPTITDELCEIIGITKKAIDGRETTNFVIAPLRYVSGIRAEESNSKKYTRVLVAESKKHHVPEEDKEFFANIYLSDYLINNAVKNNAGYLGTFEFDKKEKGVTLDLPMENIRVGACFFAQRKPGIVSKKSFSREKEAKIDNIDILLDKLKIKQIILASSDLKKLNTTISMSDIRNVTEGEEHE